MARLHPHLIVEDAPRAIRFYQQALGAREIARFVDQKLAPGGVVVHAELAIGDSKLTLSEQNIEWHNVGPARLGGSPVVLTVTVEDVDAVGQRLLAGGAEVVFPIADQFYGKREGRFRDPFGHLWLVSQIKEQLSVEEIQRGVDAFPTPAPGG